MDDPKELHTVVHDDRPLWPERGEYTLYSYDDDWNLTVVDHWCSSCPEIGRCPSGWIVQRRVTNR